MTHSRIAFDPDHIEHTNEELMRYYFTMFAQEKGIARRAAELLFRDKWDRMKRKLTADRHHTYQILKDHIDA